MKIAYKFFLFQIFIFSCLSYRPIQAKDTSTLNLKGQIPYVFGIDYERNQDYISLRNTANFNFYGTLEVFGKKVRFDKPVKIAGNKKFQFIIVTIN